MKKQVNYIYLLLISLVIIFVLATSLFSCKIAKPQPATRQQIEALKYDDLPAKKQDEFGSAYYLEHPCSDNIVTKTDTIITQTYNYGSIVDAADKAVELNNKSIEIQNDTNKDNKINQLNYLYNETLQLYYQCEKKKSVTKIIRIVDSIKDQRETDLWRKKFLETFQKNIDNKYELVLKEEKIRHYKIRFWIAVATAIGILATAFYFKFK